MDSAGLGARLRALFWGVLLAIVGVGHASVDAALRTTGLGVVVFASVGLAARWPAFRVLTAVTVPLGLGEASLLLQVPLLPPTIHQGLALFWFATLLTVVAGIPRARRPELARQIIWIRNAALAAFLAALLTLATGDAEVLAGLLYWVLLGLMVATMVSIHQVCRALPTLLRDPPAAGAAAGPAGRDASVAR